jgi:hypothetical protein
MTKLQSSLDVAIEMLKDLEEFKRSGSKEAFRKQVREEFVRRSGAASLDEALMILRQTSGSSRKRVAEPPKSRKPAG